MLLLCLLLHLGLALFLLFGLLRLTPNDFRVLHIHFCDLNSELREVVGLRDSWLLHGLGLLELHGLSVLDEVRHARRVFVLLGELHSV